LKETKKKKTEPLSTYLLMRLLISSPFRLAKLCGTSLGAIR